MPAPRGDRAGGKRARAAAAVHRHGLLGVVRIGLRRARRWAYLHEEHHWYASPLDRVLPVAMPSDCALVRATTSEDLEIASQTDKDVTVARRYLEEGHQLWLARIGDVGVFSCWVFRHVAPALAARGGWFEMPMRTVCLEAAVTSPAQRGRNIFPAAVATISSSLAAAGEEALVIKVQVGNAASHRSMEKLGLQVVARSETRKVGPLVRSVVHEQNGPDGAWITAALCNRLTPPAAEPPAPPPPASRVDRAAG